MIKTDRFRKVEITSLDDVRDWLDANHGQEESVWLVRWRRGPHGKFVDRLALLDELLCWGWIDGIARKLDADRTMQLIAPRRQQAWAQSYKDRAARLEQEERMQPPGRAAIERSKRLGLWDAYAEIDAFLVPDDLRGALRETPPAESYFNTAAPSYRRNVLRWLASAKRPATRSNRISTIAQASAEKRRLPQM
jgi:uncharacterized protein YdeI (YjbR/CyaY-like superfamily)